MKVSKKRLIAFLLLFILLIIIKIFIGGLYFYYILEELIISAVILIIINTVMMFFPFVFRLKNKKRINYTIGRKICLLNSLIIFVIITMFQLKKIIFGVNNNDIISYDPIATAKLIILFSFIIGVFYYFINMLFFVDNKDNSNK